MVDDRTRWPASRTVAPVGVRVCPACADRRPAPIPSLGVHLWRGPDLTGRRLGHLPGAARHLSDRVPIMYLGRSDEASPAEEGFAHPDHPRTQALQDEVARIEARARQFATIAGESPSPRAAPSDCRFHPRCVPAMPCPGIADPVVPEVPAGRCGARCLNAAWREKMPFG